jgi:hypothetical protein
MARGHWLPEEELQKKLDRLEADYKKLPEGRFSDNIAHGDWTL